jgi:hypothetical protein
MTQKADYTADEWQLLLEIPPAVGMAVMVAGKSGLGSMKEALALARATLSARNGYEDSALIQSLVEARLKQGERSEVETMSSPYRAMQPGEICDDVVKKCQQVTELLAAKSTAHEARQYRQWALSIGEKVAHAAKEGGFLGIGGERVSQEERNVLDAVATALEVERSR